MCVLVTLFIMISACGTNSRNTHCFAKFKLAKVELLTR